MAERNTPRRGGWIDYVAPYDVAAATKIEAGKMVALNADGNALEAKQEADGTSSALFVVGRCEATVDNSSGKAGDLKVLARAGIFRWKNSATATETVTKAHIGDVAYAEDDETVANDAIRSSGNETERPPVGRIAEVDSQGVWVATGRVFIQ